MLSRKISMTIAAEAPRLVSRIAGDLPIRIDTIRTAQISMTIPCPVCRSPLIGLPCHAGRWAMISNALYITALIKRKMTTTMPICNTRTSMRSASDSRGKATGSRM